VFEFAPCGPRMDSALSRVMDVSFEDRNGRRGSDPRGFRCSHRRPWRAGGGNERARGESVAADESTFQRLSPNRRLMRLSRRTARAMDVFPIPPGPMRAKGVRFCARPTIFLINSSRPKKALGGGGGDSPDTLDSNIRHRYTGGLDC